MEYKDLYQSAIKINKINLEVRKRCCFFAKNTTMRLLNTKPYYSDAELLEKLHSEKNINIFNTKQLPKPLFSKAALSSKTLASIFYPYSLIYNISIRE
jgi:hypothetical protein